MVAQITPLPTPPSRQDPANFSARGDAFLGALPQFQVEANTLASEVNTARTDIQAIKDQAVSETASIKNEAALSAGQAAGSAVLAEGYKNLSEQFAAAAQSAVNYLGDWSADRTYSKGQSVSYGSYIYVSKIDSNLNQIPEVVTTAWFEIKTEADLFRQPVAISPVTGTSGALPNLTLEATEFAALYSVDTRIHRRFEVALLSDASFSTPVFTAEVDADSVAITPNLSLNTAHHWRCKDVATTGESAWMLANSFVTGDISISTPA